MKKVITSKQAIMLSGIALLLSGLIFSCLQEPTYSNTPRIEFKGFSRYTLQEGSGVGQSKRDSLVITLGFTDGDGDLGNVLPLTSIESDRYQQSGGWGNYKIRTFRLENNQYKERNLPVNNFLTFPRLDREGKTRAIEGDLQLEQLYTYGNKFAIYPTKYLIQIRDRALNVSNEIETDTIHLPYSN